MPLVSRDRLSLSPLPPSFTGGTVSCSGIGLISTQGNASSPWDHSPAANESRDCSKHDLTGGQVPWPSIQSLLEGSEVVLGHL